MNESSERVLIFDPFAGISGDMVLGALVGLGADEGSLTGLPDKLGLDAHIEITKVERAGILAHSVTVQRASNREERRLGDILSMIEKAELPARAGEIARSAFRLIAEAEAAVHGVGPEEVHFHEVGAVDSIIDIVGAASAMVQLEVRRCFTRPIAVGTGWVQTSHGTLPTPAPATMKLLEGLPAIESGHQGEHTTPTGAALLKVLTSGVQPTGAFTPVRSAFGAGSRNPEGYPNCLRVVLADIVLAGPMYLVQTDVDDMSPEYVPALIERLFSSGAIDVWSMPIQMKKGRSGIRLEALVPDTDRKSIVDAIFQESTTLGVRYFRVEREVLPRSTETIEWRGFPIRVKISRTPGGHVRRKAEYEDIIRAAEQLGIPPLEVRKQVERALEQSE